MYMWWFWIASVGQEWGPLLIRRAILSQFAYRDEGNVRRKKSLSWDYSKLYAK